MSDLTVRQLNENPTPDTKTEKIGGVTLDYTYYPGEDYYCDGKVEDEILDIVQHEEPSRFEDIIRERKEWPILYHLSSARGNIVDWIPFDGTEKVLEIGAGPGAITGVLAEKCAEVTCIDLSKKRSLINAYRHRDCDNVTILVGNFEDVEPHLAADYDYIFLIGVFEYAESYLHGEQPFHTELNLLQRHLRKESGRICIAIENRLGLKYFAGCREDHSGTYFDGIEDYQNGEHPATTFTRPALEKIFRECGFAAYSFYYPYPDYKFTETLYSDRRLPEGAELSDNIRNFDRDRLLLFDETRAYQGITKDGLYPLFANSFEVILGPTLPVTYCKFSGDRDPQYRIRTELYDTALEANTAKGDEAGLCDTADTSEVSISGAAAGTSEGTPVPPMPGVAPEETRVIRKFPLTREAAAHVARMPESYRKLAARYEKPQEVPEGQPTELSPALRIAPCRSILENNRAAADVANGATYGVTYDFISGRTLESLLDEALRTGNRDAFLSLLHTYALRVGANSEVPVGDYDMTFSNIIVNGDVWTAIDYEWEVDEAVPARELLFRSLLCYLREDKERPQRVDALIGMDALLTRLCITNEEAEKLSREEDAFQNRVTGGTVALGEFRAQMGTKVIKPVELQTEEEKAEGLANPDGENRREELRQQREAYEKNRALLGVKCYFDTGNGYNENEVTEIEQLYQEESTMSFDVKVPGNVRFFRLDPCSVPCLVMLRDICIGENQDSRRLFMKYRRHNGTESAGGTILYATSDPWMDWDLAKIRRKCGLAGNRPEPDTIHITLQMAGIPGTMATMIEQKD